MLTIYDTLFARYGDPQWWPVSARTEAATCDERLRVAYEIMVGAVLTQNTAWRNVEKALAGFNGDLTPQRVASLSVAELSEIIRPSGFFNQKTAYLHALTRWFERYGYDVDAIASQPLNELRRELLEVRGVGRETADSILLYAFGLPTFVVDAYTMRLLARLPCDVEPKYAAVKALFEAQIPCDAALYNRFHGLIVVNATQHCRAKPQCDGCPLRDAKICAYAQNL